MKATEMRDKSVEELKGAEGDLMRELFNLRFQAATGEIQNPSRIRTVRREIARLRTVISEKGRAAAAQAAK